MNGVISPPRMENMGVCRFLPFSRQATQNRYLDAVPLKTVATLSQSLYMCNITNMHKSHCYISKHSEWQEKTRGLFRLTEYYTIHALLAPSSGTSWYNIKSTKRHMYIK